MVADETNLSEFEAVTSIAQTVLRMRSQWYPNYATGKQMMVATREAMELLRLRPAGNQGLFWQVCEELARRQAKRAA